MAEEKNVHIQDVRSALKPMGCAVNIALCVKEKGAPKIHKAMDFALITRSVRLGIVFRMQLHQEQFVAVIHVIWSHRMCDLQLHSLVRRLRH